MEMNKFRNKKKMLSIRWCSMHPRGSVSFSIWGRGWFSVFLVFPICPIRFWIGYHQVLNDSQNFHHLFPMVFHQVLMFASRFLCVPQDVPIALHFISWYVVMFILWALKSTAILAFGKFAKLTLGVCTLPNCPVHFTLWNPKS